MLSLSPADRLQPFLQLLLTAVICLLGVVLALFELPKVPKLSEDPAAAPLPWTSGAGLSTGLLDGSAGPSEAPERGCAHTAGVASARAPPIPVGASVS